MTEVQMLERRLIHAGSNDCKLFDEGDLQTLAQSIQDQGLIQPITVRPCGCWAMEGAHYEVVAGERRFRAMVALEWREIPGMVRTLTDEQAAAAMLVENTARVSLDPIAEGMAYQVRIERFQWSEEKIAQMAGVKLGIVRDRLALLKLAPDVQHFVATKALPIGHALLLVELDNNRQRIALRIYNAATTMPLPRFREVVHELSQQQADESQLGMFELMMVEEVQQESLTTKGKRARTGAPTNKRLPPVQIRMDDSVGHILDRHILDLLNAGYEAEAAALGNVYTTLVAFNWTGVPSGSALAKSGNDASAESAAHFTRLA